MEPLNYKPKKILLDQLWKCIKRVWIIKFTENPLRNATLDQVALVGILNSKIGNVGVVEIAGQTFYVKVGDRIGVNEGVVVDITDTALRIRQMEKDIFGNMRATVKDIMITNLGGKS